MQTTTTATWRGLDTATLLTALASAAGPFLAALQGAT